MVKFIAIEGIDGSGKATQVERLAKALQRKGYNTDTLSFPRYGATMAGELIGRYLNGDFGELNPYVAALLYALDRFESKGKISVLAQENEIVIFDRFIGSNLAHQSARMSESEREKFIDWLIVLECGAFGAKIPEVTILLKSNTAIAKGNVFKKGERSYTQSEQDLHERDQSHQELAAAQYCALAAKFHWHIVETTVNGVQRSVEDIGDEVCRVAFDRIRRRSFPESSIDAESVAKALSIGDWNKYHDETKEILLCHARAAIAEVERQQAQKK